MPHGNFNFNEEEALGKAYDARLMKRLMKYAGSYLWLFILAAFMLLASTLSDLARPYLTKVAIDDYISSGDVRSLGMIGIALIGLILSGFLFNFLQIYVLSYAGQTIIYNIRQQVFAHLQKLPLSFFDRNPVGRLVTRVTNDTEALNEMYTNVIVSLLKDIFILGGAVVIMLRLNPPLTFITLSVVPVVVLITIFFRIRIRAVYREVRTALARINSIISEDDLRAKLKVFLTELRQLSRQGGVRIETEPVPARDGNIMSTIATLVRPKRVMKVAFLHAKSASQSSWTYSHEIGRAHVEKEMKGYVTTSCVENVPESPEAYRYLKRLAKDGNDVIFATSPAFINATLKAAMEFPETRFLNCSETHSYKHVNTYFGRIYEPRFLAGVVAGAATCSDILGYVGTHPEPGVISGVNSFALGARMVNPHARVLVSWTKQWDSLEKAEHASSLLIDRGADIISHHDTLSSREFSREYGVYTVVCGIDKSKCAPGDYIAVPVWNWGIFYEKIIKSIMNDMWRTVTDRLGAGQKPVNFWWGMDSGIVDFFYSKRLVPRETQKLVEFLKRMIMNGALHPFAGPVYDRKGRLRIKQNETVTHEHITTMNWLAEGVEEVGEDL
jgi:basic membrane lipoprotein Med (substrate-binding protein (PBP1-ABC) superfamily)